MKKYAIPLLKKLIPLRYHNQAQDIRLLVQALPYRGSRYECPCCGWKLRDFILYSGAHTRRMAPTCPRCHTKERHRWLWLYLKQHTSILKQPTHLLHFAPEFCFYRLFKHIPHVQVVATDLYHTDRVNILQDITHIAFPDATFDAIICSHVLEHVPNDQQAMRELWRVLRPGGWAAISFPVREHQPTYEDARINNPEERERHFGQDDHVRWYGFDVVDRLTAVGFVVRPEHAADLDAQVIEYYRLEPDDWLFFCTKPVS